MRLSEMLQEVEDREEYINLAIDADSLLYLSCYKYRNDWDIELAYFEFSGRVKSIEREMYTKASEVRDIVLCFTAKSNFRYDIYPEYKANRKTDDVVANLLKDRSNELKKLIYSRIKPMCKASNVVEADDIVIMYAYKGYIVAAMDKDVVSQCPTSVFNFKKYKWEHEGLTSLEINYNALLQSIQGDTTDNIKGVKGIGAVKAKKLVDKLIDGTMDFNEYVDLFDTPKDMLLSNQLVNMSQYREGVLNLMTVKDVSNLTLPF